MPIDVNYFERELECEYDGERYLVRDSGAVFRQPRIILGRKRSVEAHWTFGKPSNKTGYMEIASVRVHRMVATAFHGDRLPLSMLSITSTPTGETTDLKICGG